MTSRPIDGRDGNETGCGDHSCTVSSMCPDGKVSIIHIFILLIWGNFNIGVISIFFLGDVCYNGRSVE